MMKVFLPFSMISMICNYFCDLFFLSFFLSFFFLVVIIQELHPGQVWVTLGYFHFSDFVTNSFREILNIKNLIIIKCLIISNFLSNLIGKQQGQLLQIFFYSIEGIIIIIPIIIMVIDMLETKACGMHVSNMCGSVYHHTMNLQVNRY